ncbi:hypothetical protein [Methylovulum miyakonense]|uniref:hypothetical protein n=1 Tax=Methylovulum miyakonense TaxID=645578 RepID=UPI00037D607C|nr:hypothetical protein [Methylovulum miyakonense]
MTTLELDNETATLLAEMAEQEHIEPEQLVKDLIKRHSETLTAPENDFFAYAGIWQGRNIDQETIRTDAWRQGQP